MTTLDLDDKQGWKIQHTLDNLSDPDIIMVRYTLDADEDNFETRKSIHTHLLNYLSDDVTIKFYTTGFETQKSRYPNTGLPSKPHIHVHLVAKSAKYDFTKDNEKENYKRNIRRKLQRLRQDVGIPWGKNKLYIKFEHNPDNPKELLEYPLKQRDHTPYVHVDSYRGFSDAEYTSMRTRATAKYELSMKQAENFRKRLETEGMSEFYKQLKADLDAFNSDEPAEILKKVYDFYCLKSKPINDKTIRGYALLHMFQNNIIHLDKYIKKIHKDII